MPGATFFFAIAAAGISLAGFAGLIAALGQHPGTNSEISAWRIRNIVMAGFILTIAGFATIALYTATRENATLTIRIASLLMALMTGWRAWFEHRPGPAWPSKTNWRIATGAEVLLSIGYLSSVVRGRLGWLQVLMVFSLLGPLSIFFRTVRDLAQGNQREETRDA